MCIILRAGGLTSNYVPSFIEEPESVTIERHAALNLSWLIDNGPCESGSSWIMSIATQNDSLILFFGVKLAPFPEDYDVITTNSCDRDGRKYLNVTLNILLSDEVLQNVDFVRCLMLNGREIVRSEAVHFNASTVNTTNIELTTTATTNIQTTTSPCSETSEISSYPETASTISCSAPCLLLLCFIQCVLCYFLNIR